MSITHESLIVNELKSFFFTKAGVVKAVDGVSFSLLPGKILGLVGESGSGKSVTGLSVMGLLDPPGRIVGGNILLNGMNLVDLDAENMRQLRGSKIAMIFQDAMMTLNPVLRVDTQMIEAIKAHKKTSRKNAMFEAGNMLSQLGIPAPEKRLKVYPHQLSGGMRQRVAIAIAMLNEPDFIIADEPTTALDVTIQSQILYQTQKLCRKKGTGLIWITHDLAVISGLADEICVMYAGKIAEYGTVDDVLDRPLHPYTVGLIGSVPSHNRRGKPLYQIPGMRPPLLNLMPGCSFRDRCSRSDEECHKDPEMKEILPGHHVRCFHPYIKGKNCDNK